MANTLILDSEEDTLTFGKNLAAHCPAPCVIFLQGELGAGKTTLVRGFLQALGHIGAVKSPTYTLVEPYQLAEKNIFHFDLYRINDPRELENIGLRDYFTPSSICLIEWPERAIKLLPTADLACYIRIEQEKRILTLTPESPRGTTLASTLTKNKK